jgi:chromosome partitioning protein
VPESKQARWWTRRRSDEAPGGSFTDAPSGSESSKDAIAAETGVGWPSEPRFPQNPQAGPQPAAVSTSDVSRETVEPAEEPASEPAEADEPVVAAAPLVVAPIEEPPAEEPVEEKVVTRPDKLPPEPSAFGPHPAPGATFRTAGDVADQYDDPDDHSTPLARAVEAHLATQQRMKIGERLPRPERTRVMVVANQKGGVGKTTTAVNMAAALAQHGQRVLVVDLDPQGNASTALGVDHHRGIPSSYDALVEGVPFEEIVCESPEVEGLYVVPATIDLAGAEIELVSVVARENRLRKAIHGFAQVFGEGEDRLDFVLVDCPPSLGLLTLNALVAGDEMLIPIQAEYYALEGVGQLLETVNLVKANLNPTLAISTILITMYDARTRLSAGVADEVREHFGDLVLKTAIPRSVRVSEAPSYGQTVMTYDPSSPGALSYLEAAREMVSKGAPKA